MSSDGHRDDEQVTAAAGLDPETFAALGKALSLVGDQTEAALAAALAGVIAAEPRLAGREQEIAATALATVLAALAVEMAIAIAPRHGISPLEALEIVVQTLTQSIADASGRALARREIEAFEAAARGDDAEPDEEPRHSDTFGA